MAHILTIQDISCVGRCSATAALPVLSAMGHQCSLLPTAVLSTHTGYPNPVVLPLTGHLRSMAAHWKDQGIGFDGICTGYLSGPEQVEIVSEILDSFRSQTRLVLVDPAMADHGRLYAGLPEDFPRAMASLCGKSDLILPNLTEAALLTGLPYEEYPSEARLRAMLEGLLNQGAKAVLITGAATSPDTTGFAGMDAHGIFFSYSLPRYPQNRHGTGDLFAACLMGGLMNGRPIADAGRTAAEFVLNCLRAGGDSSADPRLGLPFEPFLSGLQGADPA